MSHLPIKQMGAGLRFRSARDAMSDRATEEFADWVIPGPRTAEWCLEELTNASMEPGAAFAKYRTDLMAKVRSGDQQPALDQALMLFLEFLYEIFDLPTISSSCSTWCRPR